MYPVKTDLFDIFVMSTDFFIIYMYVVKNAHANNYKIVPSYEDMYELICR